MSNVVGAVGLAPGLRSPPGLRKGEDRNKPVTLQLPISPSSLARFPPRSVFYLRLLITSPHQFEFIHPLVHLSMVPPLCVRSVLSVNYRSFNAHFRSPGPVVCSTKQYVCLSLSKWLKHAINTSDRLRIARAIKREHALHPSTAPFLVVTLVVHMLSILPLAIPVQEGSLHHN